MGELLPNLQTAKLAASIAALSVLWALETVAPMFTERTERLRHDARNLAFGLLNAVLVAIPFSGAIVWVTTRAAEPGLGLLHRIDLPVALSWVLVFVLFDAWQYLWHLLNHKVGFLSRFHAIHHSDREMDATSAFRFHTGEIVLSSMARLAVLPLLGMTVAQLLLYEVVLVPVVMFHHSNVRVPAKLDRALRVVTVTPWMHWVHHSRDPRELNSNYSSVFSIWDRLFGTFQLREDPSKIELGLETYDERESRQLGRLLLAPFKKRSAAPMSQD